LIKLARSKELTDAQQQKILKNLIAALEGEDRFQRMGVLMALPDLGPLAASALPAVEKIVNDEASGPGRLHEMAKGVADRIRAQAAPASDTNQLREEIRRHGCSATRRNYASDWTGMRRRRGPRNDMSH
jgi:hypothetical protein